MKYMSNRLLKKLSKDRYRILATIPEDPYLWDDSDCLAFDEAMTFAEPNGRYEFYETYETAAQFTEVHMHDPDQELRIVDGWRHLIALYPDDSHNWPWIA